MPGTQESEAPTPLLRQSGIRKLKKPKENKRFSKEPRSTKLGRSRNLRSVFGAKTVFVVTCRALPEALFPSVSTSVSKRFEALSKVSRPFEASRGPSEALVFARITL